MYTTYIIVSVIIALLLWIRHLAYPRPYPGIPYNKHSSKRLFGDVPDAIDFVKAGGDPAAFAITQCRKHNSPVIQLFMRPFSRPFIFLDDDREVEDLLATRTKEFDRAPSTVAAFSTFFKHSTAMKQTTPRWRAQRRLWSDTMSADFLHRVAAPKMHKYALQLVDLFKTRAAIASGRPFAIVQDFDLVTFDIIWASVLGLSSNLTLNEQAGTEHGAHTVEQWESVDAPAEMPVVCRDPMFRASEFFNMTLEHTLSSPLPSLHQWIWRQLPTYKKHWAVKEQIISDAIKNSRHRFSHLSEGQLSGDTDTCAMDLVLRRESRAIEKSGTSSAVSPPTTREIHDELFMVLIAGHQTTATILAWATKYLTNRPQVQDRLRAALGDAFPDASAANLPSVEDIIRAKIPYLDATLEECTRLANIAPRLARVATVDTQLLGYAIPKGAIVMCSTYVGEAPFDIPESLRGAKSHEAKHSVDSVRGADMGEFRPERWLDEAGNFNPTAFRKLAFSAGPRACYGKKMAMLELRVVIAVLVMSFRFEAIPDELNGFRGRPQALRVPCQGYVRLTPLL